MLFKERIFISIFLLMFVVAVSCSSKDKITGKAAETGEEFITEGKIYEDVNSAEVQLDVNQSEELVENQSNLTEESVVEQLNETLNNTAQVEINTTPEITQELDNKTKDFKFSPDSIVSTQHNISISLDDIKYEIKSEYWGKITGITTTVLNRGNKTFKPKVLVILYDEKDFKEEWFKTKAEIEFDIDKLSTGEHITKDAIVNIAFDDINLTKNFRLILVDAVDIGNKAIAVVEREFNARFG